MATWIFDRIKQAPGAVPRYDGGAAPACARAARTRRLCSRACAGARAAPEPAGLGRGGCGSRPRGAQPDRRHGASPHGRERRRAEHLARNRAGGQSLIGLVLQPIYCARAAPCFGRRGVCAPAASRGTERRTRASCRRARALRTPPSSTRGRGSTGRTAPGPRHSHVGYAEKASAVAQVVSLVRAPAKVGLLVGLAEPPKQSSR
jgi:hypothetical protein